jgi:hypothetical protein
LRVQANLALIQSRVLDEILIVDDPELNSQHLDPHTLRAYGPPNSICDFHPDVQDAPRNLNDSEQAWLLPVTVSYSEEMPCYTGLILERVGSQDDKPIFRRWGRFRMWGIYGKSLQGRFIAFDRDSEARNGLKYCDDGKGGV